MDNIFTSTSIQLIEVDVKDLGIGMYVSKLDRPWLETTFLFQGFEIKNRADIKAVQKQCQYVYVDKRKSRKNIVIIQRNVPFSTSWIEGRTAPEKRSSFKREFAYAEAVHKRTSKIVKGFMEDVHLGRAINVEIAKEAVAECVNSILNSPDALLWLSQLKHWDEYTSEHSMNVCILSISLARQLDLPEEEINLVGLCGMMHDMGKMKVPIEILNKPGRFEPDELAIMQSHPALGWEILMESSGMPACVAEAAYGHHERLDGYGYPQGLTAASIHPYTRIVTIADMYDAIVSDRVYKKGKTHLEAINILTENSGKQLDTALVIKFIQGLGIYPPGNIVEMSNSEVAVVLEVNQVKKLKPKINMLLNEEQHRVEPRLVDLAQIELDASGQGYMIKRIARPEEFDLDLNEIYKMGVIRSILEAA